MSANTRSRCSAVLVCASVLTLAVAPFLGPVMEWAPADLIGGEGPAGLIFWRIRLPRVALGFLTGAALGAAGLAFQALFRNPLATPYTFGVAGGASFGATAAICLGLSGAVLGLSSVTFGGLAGALLATGLIFAVSGGGRSRAPSVMLLAGVAMSFFFSSLVLFLQYLSDISQSFQMVRWLMGGLEVVGFGAAVRLLPFVVAGCGVLQFFARELDAIATGEELALSRGVDVGRATRILFVVVSLMVGAAVSFSGPIGFVGIMVPHFCRLAVGVGHQRLIPIVIISSGAFLVLCDAVARMLVAPAEIPVGVVTALLGGPFFLWILLRRSGGQLRVLG